MDHRALRSHVQNRLAEFLPQEEAEAEAWRWLEEGLGRDMAWVLAHGEEAVAGQDLVKVEAWLARRGRREPWVQILGWTRWRGRRFTVGRETLIPRPETELVLEAALEVGRRLGVHHACDVGTGSGILGISLALETDWKIVATDVSRKALRVARGNAEALGAELTFLEGDLLGPVPDPVGLVVSNPPYIDPADRGGLAPELAFEPEAALFAPERGLGIAIRLLHEAHVRFAPAAVMEIGAGQGQELTHHARRLGWRKVLVHKDFSSHDRVLIALA
jgi:release factor glutamine methyltransferase